MGTCVEAKDTLMFEYGGDDTQLNSMVVTLIESSYGIQVSLCTSTFKSHITFCKRQRCLSALKW